MPGWTLELDQDQIKTLARLVKAEMESTQFQRPLTVSEFQEATGLSRSQLYREVHAGRIRRVPNISKILIPCKELAKFQ